MSAYRKAEQATHFTTQLAAHITAIPSTLGPAVEAADNAALLSADAPTHGAAHCTAKCATECAAQHVAIDATHNEAFKSTECGSISSTQLTAQFTTN